ncbi:glycosyltransferase family 52 [Megamonas funiformis]|uniref:glycosyltransferase family 52 n=1 Tax=Megamonas funiformis TaxID=437897 RepID=UPI003A901689
MKNLFVVNTPYHLLTCFILTHSIYENDENYLVLMHPHGYEKWKINKLMTYMSTIKCGYKQVFLLLDWLSSKNKKESYRKQANYVKENIKPLNIDKVFIGVDISPVNQLLVMAVGKNEFYRFEDGVYSYINENRRRKKSHALFHKLKTYLLKWISGIQGNMYINTEAEGESPAGKLDIMYQPWLLQRKSPATKEITVKMINQAMQDLKSQQLLNEVFQEESILYLSQPMVEKGLFTIEKEVQCLKKILLSIGSKAVLYYKPHPNDSKEKLEYYRNNFKQLKIYDGIEPAELLFTSNSKLKAVISYQSSALLNVNKFSNEKIKAVTFISFIDNSIEDEYINLMKKSNVLDIMNFLNEK